MLHPLRSLERRWYKACDGLVRRLGRLQEGYYERRGQCRAAILRFITPRGYSAFINFVVSLAFKSTRRRLFHIALGLGSVILTAAAALALTLTGREYLKTRFAEAEAKAMVNGDTPRTVDALRWLVRLEPSDPSVSLRLSQALAANGHPHEANQILDQLTPSDGVGYPPAYLVKAQRAVAADDVSPERLHCIENELERIGGIDNDQVLDVKIQLWLRTGRFAAVDDLIHRAVSLSPDARMMVARTYASLGMRSSAVRQANLIKHELIPRLEAKETSAHRLLLAQAYGIGSEFAAVEKVLHIGRLLHPRGTFVNELCRLHFQLSQQPGLSTINRLQLINTAIDILPATNDLSPEQYLLLYQLHSARGDNSQASECLSKAAAAEPAHRMELAHFLMSRGGEVNARAIVENVKTDCLAQLRCSADRRGARLLLAEAQVFLVDYEGAATSLAEAYERIADPAYAVALHRTYLAWWDAKSKSSSLSPDYNLEVLEKAARYCPRSLELIKRLHDARRLIPQDSPATLERLQSLVRHVASLIASS